MRSKIKTTNAESSHLLCSLKLAIIVRVLIGVVNNTRRKMGNTEIKEAEYYPVLGASIVSHKNIESKYTVYVIQVCWFRINLIRHLKKTLVQSTLVAIIVNTRHQLFSFNHFITF